MFCPNCGANNIIGQKFCRSCGLNLEQTAISLLEQIPSSESAGLLKRQRNLEKFGNIAFGGLGLVLLTAVGVVFYFIITRMILSGLNVFFGILLIAFLSFALLSLVYVVFNEILKEGKQKMNPTRTKEFSEKLDTGKLLEEKPFETVPSVIEDSTELLFAKNKTRKFE
ncbi:MAG: zinc-ribbon domain-containing protein [Pyrinomonadaceae bacterium]